MEKMPINGNGQLICKWMICGRGGARPQAERCWHANRAGGFPNQFIKLVLVVHCSVVVSTPEELVIVS